nr:glycosyltransferase [uncultured Ligilactobacillus sp.]
MEKISVLMSVYYKENPKYLRESLQSLLNQTQIPDEILLIKDGPLTVALDNVIDEFEEAYPQIFTIKALKENHGLAYALAYGVKEAKYEYIARMDSDDIAVPERLATQLIEMTKNYYDIYGGQIVEFEGTTENIIAKREVPTDLYHIKQFAHRRNPMNHMTVMFKRSVILELGNYHEINGFEDYDLWVRAIMAGCKLGNSSETFVYVRAGHDMVGRRGGWNYVKENFEVRKAFKDEGFYNTKDFLVTTLGMTATSMIPDKLRYFIYYKMLRKQ